MLDAVCLTGWLSGFRKAFSKRLVAKISSSSGVTRKLSLVEARPICSHFPDFAKTGSFPPPEIRDLVFVGSERDDKNLFQLFWL